MNALQTNPWSIAFLCKKTSKSILPFVISLCLLLCPLIGKAQQSRKVLGSFRYKGEVYNYEFNKFKENSYKFDIVAFDPKTEQKSVDSLKAKTAAATTAKDSITKDSALLFANGITNDFSREILIAVVKAQMKQKYKIEMTENEVSRIESEIYADINPKLTLDDDEPVTATLSLRKPTIYSFLKEKSSAYYNGRLSELIVQHNVDRIEVETEDGAIKNISVYVVQPNLKATDSPSPRRSLEFKNQYPISISGKFDSERLANVNLYCSSCGGIKGLSRFLKLSDAIKLEIDYENFKEDYSPANKVISLSPIAPVIQLKKEKRSKIIEFAAFSDLIGMDKEQPNGLIQIEARRKININTNFIPVFESKDNEDITSKYDLTELYVQLKGSLVEKQKSKKQADKPDQTIYYLYKKSELRLNKQSDSLLRIMSALKISQALRDSLTKELTVKVKNPSDSIMRVLSSLSLSQRLKDSIIQELSDNGLKPIDSIVVKNTPFRTYYYNTLGYIEPKLLFSKLENNNKFLLLNAANSEGNKIQALKVYQHQLATFGANLNVFRMSFPQAKFTINFLDLGVYWYRTRVKLQADSAIASSEALNSSYWSAALSFTFRPDSRWGVNAGMLYLK